LIYNYSKGYNLKLYIFLILISTLLFIGCGGSESENTASNGIQDVTSSTQDSEILEPVPPSDTSEDELLIPLSLIVGETKQFVLTTDASLSYEVLNLPTWVSYDSTTGKGLIIANEVGHGQYDIKITSNTGTKVYSNALQINVYPHLSQLQNQINSLAIEPIETVKQSLGSIQVGGEQFFRNPDGKTWTVCIPYWENYKQNQQIITVDLSTGKVGSNNSNDFETESWNGFMAVAGPNNKTYTNPKDANGLIHMHVYDTSTHTWQPNVVQPRSDHKGNAQPSQISLGVNKRIYSLGVVGNGNLSVLELDPSNNTTRFYGDIDAGGDPRAVAADNEYIYVLADPYGVSNLIAINLETNVRTLLLSSASTLLHQRKHGVIAQLNNSYYWLYKNKAIPTNDLNSNPPWGFDDTNLYEESNAIDLPNKITDMDKKGIIPAGNSSTGKFWYKDPYINSSVYKFVDIPDIKKYPEVLSYGNVMSNGKILFLASSYSGYSIFNTNNNDLESYLPIEGRVSNYTASYNEQTQKMYISGYFGGISYEYDLNKPWTNTVSNEYNPNNVPSSLNPRYLGGIGNVGNIGKPYGSAIGKDGLFYIGGERIRTGDGGGLATYNPQTHENEGITTGFEQDDVRHVVRAGKFIVASSKSTNNSHPIRLSVYDTNLKKVVRTIDITGLNKYTGKLSNYSDNETIVYFLGKTDDNQNTKIMKFDVSTGQIIFDRTYPFVDTLNGGSLLSKANDGFLYTIFGINILVRIDPTSGDIEPVLEVNGGVKGMVSHANYLYLTWTSSVSRISNFKINYNQGSF